MNKKISDLIKKLDISFGAVSMLNHVIWYDLRDKIDTDLFYEMHDALASHDHQTLRNDRILEHLYQKLYECENEQIDGGV